MAKQINIKYKDVDYTLEFTRKSIEKLEKTGFVLSDIESKPMTTLPRLFNGAFLAHHPFIKSELTDEIFDHISDKERLLVNLVEMYSEPIIALISEPADDEKNVEWGASW